MSAEITRLIYFSKLPKGTKSTRENEGRELKSRANHTSAYTLGISGFGNPAL